MIPAVSRFDICLPYTLAQECPFPKDWSNPKNFSNDAHDPGGETMCGIIQREYDQARKHWGKVCQDVRRCTKDEGYAIYRGTYWDPHCPALLPGLDLEFFDSSVNEGCFEAVKILQHILGLEVDGLWGPHTATRVAGIQMRDLPSIVRTFTMRRDEVYRQTKGFQYFGKDWENRSNQIGAIAEKMAKGEPLNG